MWIELMADVIGWVFFFAVAAAGWGIIVLGTVYAIRAMKRAGWPAAAIALVAVLAMVALVLVWPFYGVWRLGLATYHRARPRPHATLAS
jgi:hypothetical protein